MMPSRRIRQPLIDVQRLGHSRATRRQRLQTCVTIRQAGIPERLYVLASLSTLSSSTKCLKIVAKISSGRQDIYARSFLRERRTRIDSANVAMDSANATRSSSMCSTRVVALLGVTLTRGGDNVIMEDLRGEVVSRVQVEFRRNVSQKNHLSLLESCHLSTPTVTVTSKISILRSSSRGLAFHFYKGI